MYVCFFYQLFVFQISDTENNANFDAASSKRAKFDGGAIFLNIPKLIIFGTHNLQTFKHNTLIHDLLLM